MKLIFGLFFCATLVGVWHDAFGCDCGVARLGKRIVGGSETKVDAYPWMAGLIGNRDGSYFHFCGGSLICDRWILTAAHCITETKIQASQIIVTLGDHDLNSNSETPSQGKRVEKIIVHPNYNSKTQDNDMALLKLTTNVTYNEYIRPVCFPPSTFNPEGKTATVSGWGKVTEEGKSATKLREVSVPILTKAQCQSAYSGTGVTVTDNMICAGVTQGGKDSCQGDSGGPLVTKCSNGRFVQCGVVSFGIGCGRPGFPGFYSSVPKLTSWIAANVEKCAICGSTC